MNAARGRRRPALFFAIGAVLSTLAAHAQPLIENPYKFATPAPADASTVNPDAWNSFASGNVTRWFGRGADQDFSVSVDYTNRVIVLGKKASEDTILPAFSWVGPLFGGEGYSEVSGGIPLQSPYAAHLFVKGGWRYELTKYLNLDLGGSVNLYNKSVFGQGLPAPWGYRANGPFWVGLTGNVISSPAVYFTYDPVLGQSIESLGFSHVFNLGKFIGVAGLYVCPTVTGGLLQANVYNGGDKVLGHNWRNGYSYFDTTLDADYEIYHHVYLRAGVEWGVNNDGSGSTGIAGTNLGPDNNVSFHAGIIYSF